MLNRVSIALALLLFVFCSPTAHATGEGQIEFRATLVGWSSDGQCYAVIERGWETHGSPTAHLFVRCESGDVAGFCTDDEPSNECFAETVLKRRKSQSFGALERMNVETDQALAKYRLRAFKPKWKDDFAAEYSVKSGKRCDDKVFRCVWRFRVYRRGKLVGELTQTGDLTDKIYFLGGFALGHDGRVLLKLRHFGTNLYGVREIYHPLTSGKDNDLH